MQIPDSHDPNISRPAAFVSWIVTNPTILINAALCL